MAMEPHILRHRDACSVSPAHTVVTEDVRRNRHEICQGAITLWAKEFTILRYPITDKISFQKVTTPRTKVPGKR